MDGLGGVLRYLGRSERPLGNVWGAILASLGPILWMSGASWARKNMQKLEKILVKRPSHLDFNFGMIFDRFGIVFLVPGNLILVKF